MTLSKTPTTNGSNGYCLPEGRALVLRTSDRYGRSTRGFQWPSYGPVSAPDWNPTSSHGGGLWGLLWGHGDTRHLCYRNTPRAVWQVVEVDAAQVVFKHGKVKYPAGIVRLTSRNPREAVAFLNRHRPPQVPVLFMNRAGDLTGDSDTGQAGQRVIASFDFSIAVLTIMVMLGTLNGRSLMMVLLGQIAATAMITFCSGSEHASEHGQPVTWLPASSNKVVDVPDAASLLDVAMVPETASPAAVVSIADEVSAWLATRPVNSPDTGGQS